MNILSLKNLSYSYEQSSVSVLDNVSANFESGKMYSIMGKSGAGKTTILSLISGLDVCTSGEILFKGNPIKNINRDEYRAKDIGVIFQGFNLLTNVTAIENIILSMNISGAKIKDKKKFVYELLEKVGIDRQTANRKILKLSGGEQQRIGIARALASNPDIIIADEPTGNLDKETEDNIMDIFMKLVKEENKCVVIVTHSNKIAGYADEVWGLIGGKLNFVK